MAEAKRDSNRVVTMIGVSKVDLETPVNIAIEPTTNALIIEVV